MHETEALKLRLSDSESLRLLTARKLTTYINPSKKFYSEYPIKPKMTSFSAFCREFRFSLDFYFSRQKFVSFQRFDEFFELISGH